MFCENHQEINTEILKSHATTSLAKDIFVMAYGTYMSRNDVYQPVLESMLNESFEAAKAFVDKANKECEEVANKIADGLNQGE